MCEKEGMQSGEVEYIALPGYGEPRLAMLATSSG
jgi:hypothetical protein